MIGDERRKGSPSEKGLGLLSTLSKLNRKILTVHTILFGSVRSSGCHSVRPSVCLCGTNLSKALNIYLSPIGLSHRSLKYFVLYMKVSRTAWLWAWSDIMKILFFSRFRGPRDSQRDPDADHTPSPGRPYHWPALHLQPQARNRGHGNMNLWWGQYIMSSEEKIC